MNAEYNKIVTIKRLPNSYVRRQLENPANQGTLISKTFETGANVRISPSISSITGNKNTGLTPPQIEKYLPELLGMDPKDPGFRKAVLNFYNEIHIAIPHTGRDFNIGVDNDGWPVNLKDFVEFKALEASKSICAPSLKEAIMNRHLVYVERPEQVEEDIDKQLSVELKVSEMFSKLSKEDYEILLWLMPNNLDVANTTPAKQKEEVYKFAKKRPQEFIALMQDLGTAYQPGKTRLKYILKKAVSMNVLKQAGTSYVYDNVVVGATLDQAVTKLQADDQLRTVLRSRINDIVDEATKPTKSKTTKSTTDNE